VLNIYHRKVGKGVGDLCKL